MPATAAKKQRFRVLEGQAYLKNPDFAGTNPHDPARMTLLTKGQVVDHEEDLEAKWPNKFGKVLDGQGPTIVTEARRNAVSQLIAQGSWGDEDRGFLEGLIDDAFERIQKNAEKKGSVSDSGSGKKHSSPLGEEVTDAFQQAYDNGFRVYRNVSGKHQVTYKGTKPVNPKPLEAAQVETFVGDYLREVSSPAR
jgi:hypothetical protein